MWTGSHPKPHSFKSLLPHQVRVIMLMVRVLVMIMALVDDQGHDDDNDDDANNVFPESEPLPSKL